MFSTPRKAWRLWINWRENDDSGYTPGTQMLFWLGFIAVVIFVCVAYRQ